MLHLRLLGEPLLLGDREPGQLWRSHVALLALLALAPERTTSRAILAGMCWPETPEPVARRSLRQALFQLRRSVGEVIVTSGDLVRLEPSRIVADVCRFEEKLDAGRFHEAVDLYADDFLAGFALGTAPFDEWADRQRARLLARACAAYQALAEGAAGEGRWTDALRWAERWAAREPFSEPAATLLITLRARSGDRSGAIATYESFRARLLAELEIAPGPALVELVERLLRFHPAVPVAVPAGSAPAGSAPAGGPQAAPPLVGREAEFAHLHAVWRRARAGQRQFLMVTGEAGIGKTRLVQEFGSWVQLNGATVLRGRAYEVERTVPYSTLAGVLRGALEAPGLAGVDAASLGELSRIVPEFASRFRDIAAPAQADLEAGRVRLLEALRTLFENLAFEAPVLLLVDDLAWADPSSLAALHYLWRGLEAAPLLVLATARGPDESDPDPVQRLLGSLRRDSPGAFDRFALEPLGSESIARLAQAFGVAPHDDPAAAVLREETGGNPLFLVEALRARREGTQTSASPTVRAVIGERVGSLSASARDLLRAAAVLGRRFPFPFAAALASLRLPDAVDALEELLNRRLLQQVEYEYDFLHDVVRQTVYEELSTERRRLLHRLALERLTPLAGEHVGLERASSLAMHALRGGKAPEARHWLLRAAEHARELFAGAEAERFLTQALDTADTDEERGAILEQIARVRFAQSRFAAAALAYSAVIATTPAGSTERLRLRTRLLDSSLRSDLLDLDGADDAIEQLLADAEAAGHTFHRDVLIVTAQAHLFAGRFAPAEIHASRAVAAARAAAEPGPLVRALLLHAQCSTFCRAPTSPLPILHDAILLATRHGLQRELCDAETDYATELCRLDRWDEAIEIWNGVIERSTRIGVLGALAVAHLNLGDVLLRRGDWDGASAHFDRAEELARRYSFPHVTADVLANRALLCWQRGMLEEAIDCASQAVAFAQARCLTSAHRNARALRALGLLALGDPEAAQREVEALSALGGAPHSTWSDDGELATLAHARLAARGDDPSAAVRLLESALQNAWDSYARALLQLEIADLLREADPCEARRHASLAADVAARLEAHPLLTRAARLLAMLPAPPRTETPT